MCSPFSSHDSWATSLSLSLSLSLCVCKWIRFCFVTSKSKWKGWFPCSPPSLYWGGYYIGFQAHGDIPYGICWWPLNSRLTFLYIRNSAALNNRIFPYSNQIKNIYIPLLTHQENEMQAVQLQNVTSILAFIIISGLSAKRIGFFFFFYPKS